MPYSIKKHEAQDTLLMDDFRGGMNASAPSTLIAENECERIENLMIDPRSGRLRTRSPITKYTASAASGIVNGLYYWESTWFYATTGGDFGYVDGSLEPISLGTLNGSSRPVFCPYNSKLIVASGGAIQYTYMDAGVPQALADVAGGPTAGMIMEKYSRLVSAGDPTYPDRIQEGTYTDETTWSATEYGDVGYLDGTSVVAIAEAFEGMYIVFKRGASGLKTYYVASLSNENPVSVLVTDGHAPLSHAGVVIALGKVFVMEENFVSALVGSDRQGKIEYDPGPGMKLHSSFTATSSGFAVLYPRDLQIWFVPDPTANVAWIYHYTRNAWTKYTFGTRRLYSAYYDPVSGYLYAGCEDGYIYKYDRASSTFADTAGSYTQLIRTRTVSVGNREVVVKSPVVHWDQLINALGTIYVSLDFASSIQNWGSIETTGMVYVWDTRATGDNETYVYDTRAAGSDPTYVYDTGGISHQYKRCDYNRATDSFQFIITVTSGAMVFDKIVVETAMGRRV